MSLHVCLDLDLDRDALRAALRNAAVGMDTDTHDALCGLAEAVQTAPDVPGGTLAQFVADEKPGEGLTFVGESAARMVRVGVDEFLRLAPNARVARVAVVVHLVERGE